ncbi:alpha/beta hydrolase [Actinophytocola sp.]|uniref:alpha/beta hydrolase family protein n=1 Tax=Actinophytocola sp. TaxID=1872138 RepID=UPI002ED83ED5
MRRGVRILPALALAVTLGAGVPTAAHGAGNPFERGPDPTEAGIEASRGAFAVSETTVSRAAVSGFGGGTIYYPTSTAEGTFGAVAISPGYTATQSSISWIGPRLASQGFVVIIIDTLTIYDQPGSRGDQLRAALSYLTSTSPVGSRIDPSRLAVAGHSMGGGGSLEAANDQPSLQAAVPIAPWHTTKAWPGVRVPTFVIGGESDTVAPVSSHAIPFYESIPASSEKAYLELDNASHFFPQTPNTTMAKYLISWLKRFVDDDTRYEQFLCPAPDDLAISQYRDTCPHS